MVISFLVIGINLAVVPLTGTFRENKLACKLRLKIEICGNSVKFRDVKSPVIPVFYTLRRSDINPQLFV
jgi:hypothetical protein